MGMSNAVLTSYSQHIFFHDETSERISLVFFPDLFSVGSCSENSSLGPTSSVAPRSRNEIRHEMCFHFALPVAVSPKVAQIRIHRCFSPLFDGIFVLAAIANRGLVWAPPPTKRFDSNFPSCIPENFLSTISFSGPTTNVPWSRTGGQMPKQKRGARGQPRSCTFFFFFLGINKQE